jgi:hypothetical protein
LVPSPPRLQRLVCGATPCHPLQGRFTTKNFVYVFTLRQTVFQPNVVVRPSYSSGSRNFKTSYRCPIVNSHPYRCQLFRYWARVALLLSAPTNQHAYHRARRPPSLNLGAGTLIAIPGSYFTPMAVQYASFHCDLSIAAVQFSFSGVGYLQQLRLH